MNLNLELNNILNIGEKNKTLHLELRPITLLIGPNGSGKSTFSNLIHNLINSNNKDYSLFSLGNDSNEYLKIKNDLIDFVYFFNEKINFNSVKILEGLELTKINKNREDINYNYVPVKFQQNFVAKDYYKETEIEYTLFNIDNHKFDIKTFNNILKNSGIAEELLIEKKDEILFVSLKMFSKTYKLSQIPRGFQKLLFLYLILINKFLIGDNLIEYIEYKGGYIKQHINPIVLIEEPEAGLHPNLQAKLIETLKFPFLIQKVIYSYKTYPMLLIETHSEYLIRSYQREVAIGNLDSKDICIIYFDQNNEDKILPRMIEIDGNGFLSEDFGKGFMDEASSLIHDLRKIRMENKN